MEKKKLRQVLRAGLAALFAVGIAIVPASPGLAEVDEPQYLYQCIYDNVACQNGEQVAPYFSYDFSKSGSSQGIDASARIAYDGDYVYVYDSDEDGFSAIAEVQSPSGSVNFRYCRNALGYGTWARCNFDWLEPQWHELYLAEFDASHGGGYLETGPYEFWD